MLTKKYMYNSAQTICHSIPKDTSKIYNYRATVVVIFMCVYTMIFHLLVPLQLHGLHVVTELCSMEIHIKALYCGLISSSNEYPSALIRKVCRNALKVIFE